MKELQIKLDAGERAYLDIMTERNEQLAAATARVKELEKRNEITESIAENRMKHREYEYTRAERYREALVHIGEEHDEDSGNGPALRRRGLARLALASPKTLLEAAAEAERR
jgi:hypothetical protein